MEKAVSQPLLAEVPHPSQSFPVVGMGSGVGVQGERRSHQDSSRTQVTQRRVPSQRPVIGGMWMCPPAAEGVIALQSKRPPVTGDGLTPVHTAQAP